MPSENPILTNNGALCFNEVRKSVGSPAKSGTTALQQLLKLPFSKYTIKDLPVVASALKKLSDVRRKLYRDEYDSMASSTIQLSHDRLSVAKIPTTEHPESELYPRECLKEIESFNEIDRRFMVVLLNSTKIISCNWPSFEDLTKERMTSDEFQFEITFSFGFSLKEIRQVITKATRQKNVPVNIGDCIGDFVGDSFFKVKLIVYFDKSKQEWSEQDGEAWIFHRGKRNKLIDVVNFDTNERIYYVENWPLKGLVVDSDDVDPKKLEDYERKMIAWQCCQIVWFALGSNLNPKTSHCVAVRNTTKKLMFVLKGWFTGLLLGESFEPDNVTFEHEGMELF